METGSVREPEHRLEVVQPAGNRLDIGVLLLWGDALAEVIPKRTTAASEQVGVLPERPLGIGRKGDNRGFPFFYFIVS